MIINRAIAWHTFHQHHWIRLSLLGLVLLFVFLSSGAFDQRNNLIALTPFLVWLLGSGTIGRDMASGVNHLLFTRPVSRQEYVITKWASLATAVMAFHVCILLTWILGKWTSHDPFVFSFELIQDFGIALWVAAVLSPVVICFSAIMSGWGDLALLLYCHVVILVMNTTNAFNHYPFITDLTNIVMRILWPGAHIAFLYVDKNWTQINLSDCVVDTGIGALYLLAAVLVMNRKNIGNMST